MFADDKATQTLIEQQQTNPEFDSFLRQAAALPESEGQNLLALLLTPIQRVPRYRLLLADMLKSTPSDHPDYADLTEAYRTANQVATFINQSLKYARTCARRAPASTSHTALTKKPCEHGPFLYKPRPCDPPARSFSPSRPVRG